MYIIRSNNKTVFHLEDGRDILTYIPVKSFFESLPKDIFVNINKGVIINKKYVTLIDKENYTMMDGEVLYGRVRAPAQHKKNKELYSQQEKMIDLTPYYILEEMPYCTFVLELVYNEEKLSKPEFVIRYWNKKMCLAEKMAREEVIGKTIDEIKKPILPEWMNAYMRCTATGHNYLIQGLAPDLNQTILETVWSPKKNFIVCMLMDPGGIVDIKKFGSD